MNTLQIQMILTTDKETKKKFLGVFPRDKLPKKIPYPSCLVFNTDNSNNPGQHWLALFYDSKRNCEFFDSMGFDPSFYNLEVYIKKTSRKVSYLKRPLQSIFSTFCGYYCVLYILLRCRGKSIFNFSKIFSKDSQKNDKFIKKMILKRL